MLPLERRDSSGKGPSLAALLETRASSIPAPACRRPSWDRMDGVVPKETRSLFPSAQFQAC